MLKNYIYFKKSSRYDEHIVYRGILNFLLIKPIFFFLDDDLLAQLREVSADAIYDTIEFNEFLQMMSKQQVKLLSKDSLKDAFRYKIKSLILKY